MNKIYASLYVLILSCWASSTLAETIYLTCDMVSTRDPSQRDTIEFWFDLDAREWSLSSKPEDVRDDGSEDIWLFMDMDRQRGGGIRTTFVVNRYDLSIWTLNPSGDGQCRRGRREKQF